MSNNKTITVTVQATGSLKKQVPPGTTVHNVRTVGEAVTRLALPETGELMLLVNGRLAYWGTELKDGDVVQLVPAVSGG